MPNQLEAVQVQSTITLAKPGEKPPEKKQPISRKELGQLRKRFITVQHAIVKACGHKLNPYDTPKNNCMGCWEAHFMNGVIDLPYIHKLLDADPEGVEVQFGKKFVKMLRRYVRQKMESQNEETSLNHEQIGIQGVSTGLSGETPSVPSDSI